ncbi:uncharacterized protein N7459_003727 [Penicillium hispanicum]|uniref:uncharacterized protein n=1 Tax=Penicillium hispanicum TaxID=1080232 RepID=UPI0025409236|nr:uncharacterized protein N7459_003727 [Penicillium hispanicum]KAJ5587962.1 hypothetical protein N7459_003727 [Penicillium hispanicum]
MSEIPPAEVVNGRKTFIPLENNPEVLSRLCDNLGVGPGLAFYDVFSTDPDWLAEIPRPVHAVILLCDRPIYNTARAAVEPTIAEYQGSGPDEPIVWMRQTIGHACGLMALLHCILNLDGGRYIIPGSQLAGLLQQAIQLGPRERADLLYQSSFLEKAYMVAASRGASAAPSPREDNCHHFIALVQKDGQVWELNGAMNGPFLRGTLAGEDLLSERGLAMTVQEFLDIAAQGGHQEMSIVAVSGTGDRVRMIDTN